MASTERLSPSVLQDIARQVAARLTPQRALLAPGAPPAALGESLRIRILPLSLITHGTGPLSTRLHDMGQWHHQLYQGDRAVGFARSAPASGGADARHNVVEVSRSELPQALQETISWIDANVSQDADASILMAPSYFLTAIYLHGPNLDAVVIASMADGLKGLDKYTLVPSEDFLERLAQNAPVVGAGEIGRESGSPEAIA